MSDLPPVYGPIHEAPLNVTPPHRPYQRVPSIAQANRSALFEAVDGLELGEFDRRCLEWLAGWDTQAVAPIVSLLHRARQLGRDEARGEG